MLADLLNSLKDRDSENKTTTISPILVPEHWNNAIGTLDMDKLLAQHFTINEFGITSFYLQYILLQKDEIVLS